VLGAVGIGNGDFTVTGRSQTYFGDASFYNQILNNTQVSDDMRLRRGNGNREVLLFDFPAIKLSSGSPSVGGKNQDVMIQAGFTAIKHATLEYTISVERSWYLPVHLSRSSGFPKAGAGNQRNINRIFNDVRHG
jgi:hypothetical protein